VELAAVVQKADEFTRATAGAKLSIIAEQASIYASITRDGHAQLFFIGPESQFCNLKEGDCSIDLGVKC
jgi:hypothetical protein